MHIVEGLRRRKANVPYRELQTRLHMSKELGAQPQDQEMRW